MTALKNVLRKLDCGKFYVIIHSGDPEYSEELKRSTDLTDEEYECISDVVDRYMPIERQISYTRVVFGKTAFLDKLNPELF